MRIPFRKSRGKDALLADRSAFDLSDAETLSETLEASTSTSWSSKAKAAAIAAAIQAVDKGTGVPVVGIAASAYQLKNSESIRKALGAYAGGLEIGSECNCMLCQDIADYAIGQKTKASKRNVVDMTPLGIANTAAKVARHFGPNRGKTRAFYATLLYEGMLPSRLNDFETGAAGPCPAALRIATILVGKDRMADRQKPVTYPEIYQALAST